MKKVGFFLVIFIGLFLVVFYFGRGGSSSNVTAQTINKDIAPESDLMVTITDDNKSVIITRYNGDEKTVVIPAIIQGLPVIQVGGFSFNKTVTTVIIPEGVTTISNNAFAYCENLNSVSLPSTITSLGEAAFYNSGLSTFPDSWPKALTVIDDGKGFIGIFHRTKLRNVVIPEGITKIGMYAFFRCTELISVSLPSTIREIGDSAFNGCSALTTVNIPATVRSIEFGNLRGDGVPTVFQGSDRINQASKTRLKQLGYNNPWW